MKMHKFHLGFDLPKTVVNFLHQMQIHILADIRRKTNVKMRLETRNMPFFFTMKKHPPKFPNGSHNNTHHSI